MPSRGAPAPSGPGGQGSAPRRCARTRPTAGRRAREVVYAALREAGVDDERLAQTERLVSTAILGFAASEAAGRFRNHSRRQLDADFGRLLKMLGQFIESESQGGAAARGRARTGRR